jgi:hypothetical protein
MHVPIYVRRYRSWCVVVCMHTYVCMCMCMDYCLALCSHKGLSPLSRGGGDKLGSRGSKWDNLGGGTWSSPVALGNSQTELHQRSGSSA